MNKLPVVVLIFLSVILSSRLTESEPVRAICAVKDTTVDINPNGSSELSLLMRKMEAHTVAARKDVISKKTTSTFPEDFLKIYTAKPTDATTKAPSFDPFADVYIHALNNFRASTDKDLVENYNNIVNACLACHSQHCPGPVSRIKKLLIVSSVK